MTVDVTDGILDSVMIEMSASDTLADMRKKLTEKGARVSKFQRFISNGKALREDVPLGEQGLKSGSKVMYIVKSR